MKNFTLKLPFVLTGIFLLSVLVRLPNLNRPLSKHHEFCTAVALRVMDLWYQNGITKFHGNPVMSYQNRGDAGVNDNAGTTGLVRDAGGNFYYVSHPPLAYYLPYATFKMLKTKPGVLPLEIFNLVFHFLTALFIFLIARCISEINLDSGDVKKNVNAGALFAFTTYCFTPATLWFHSNVYMSDMFVQVFFAFSLYVFIKQFLLKENAGIIASLSLGISIFLMCYTTWLGYFVSAAFVGYIFIIGKLKSRKWNTVLIISILFSLLALGLTFVQYKSINGSHAYLKEMSTRLNQRDSISHNVFKTLLHVFFNYLTSYLPYLLFIPIGLWFLKYKRRIQIFSHQQIHVLLLAVIPCLLLHFFLLNYSGHDFTTLPAAIILSLTCGIIFEKLFHSTKKVNAVSIAIAIVIVGIGQYYFINRPSDRSLNGERYDTYKTEGEFIASKATPEKMIFILNHRVDPQLVYYAKRNLQFIKNVQDAYPILESSRVRKGLVFAYDSISNQLILKQDIGVM